MREVCFIIPSMEGGGAERVIANLAHEMLSRDIHVSILTTINDREEYILDDVISRICIGSKTEGSIKEALSRLHSMRGYFRSHRDTVFVSMETNTNIYALVASIGLDIKLLVSERNDPNKYNHIAIRDFVYNAFGKGFVFQTNDAKKCFCDRIQQRSHVIANPVKSGLPDLRGEKKDNVVFAVGRLEPQKNYYIMIDAFAEFVSGYPDYQLHIYGKGHLEDELRDYIQHKKMSDRIILEGFSDNVWDDEKNAKMYALSSDYEGMPNALIEAMSVGMAVISTNCPIGGPEELINNEKSGILVKAGDSKSMAEAMRRIASDEEFRQELSEEAFKLRDRLNISRICDQWLDCIY